MYMKPRGSHWSENWILLEQLRVSKGRLPEIGYSPKEKSAYKWCVRYRGSGHYFRSAEGAVAYAYGRTWICSTGEAERLVDELEVKAKKCDQGVSAYDL